MQSSTFFIFLGLPGLSREMMQSSTFFNFLGLPGLSRGKLDLSAVVSLALLVPPFDSCGHSYGVGSTQKAMLQWISSFLSCLSELQTLNRTIRKKEGKRKRKRDKFTHHDTIPLLNARKT